MHLKHSVGALYLDQGFDRVGLCRKIIFPYVEDDELDGVVDFKTVPRICAQTK